MKRHNLLKHIVFLLTLALINQKIWAQNIVETDLGTQSPSVLVQNLLGIDVAFSNVVYQGANSQAGTFTGGNGIVGFNSGIILSNGAAAGVVGPAPSTPAINCVSPVSQYDPDLINLAGAGATLFDVASLSFDFVPQFNTISFQYVFASDEYNQWVGSIYNDVFGFFVNGINEALVPGTTTIVSINTVNNCVNPAYFIDNSNGQSSTIACPVTRPNANLNTSMYGLTTVLTMTAAVNPGVTNHIKLAICDVGDCQIDSNIFIQSNTFNSGPTPTPTPTPSPTCTPTPTPTLTPCGYPGNTCTPTNTPTLTPTPVSADIFYVSKNLFTPSNPVSIFVDYTTYPGHYALWIYNTAGEHVKTLADRELSGPVSESYLWDGTNKYNAPCASGVYILYLVEPLSQKMKRVVLIK